MIGCLPYPTATVPHHILKPPVLGPVGCVVPQMPFTHHAGRIPIFGKQVPKSLLRSVHHGTARTGSISTGDTRIISGHQSSPRRRAKGVDMKIGETDRFGVQAVEVGSFKDGVSVTTKISIPLIIGHDENYIGLW